MRGGERGEREEVLRNRICALAGSVPLTSSPKLAPSTLQEFLGFLASISVLPTCGEDWKSRSYGEDSGDDGD